MPDDIFDWLWISVVPIYTMVGAKEFYLGADGFPWILAAYFAGISYFYMKEAESLRSSSDTASTGEYIEVDTEPEEVELEIQENVAETRTRWPH